jgi:hypothetical protein
MVPFLYFVSIADEQESLNEKKLFVAKAESGCPSSGFESHGLPTIVPSLSQLVHDRNSVMNHESTFLQATMLPTFRSINKFY